MKCPECQEMMKQVSMYGTDEEINIDYICDSCGCLAILKWLPQKKAEPEPESIYANPSEIKDDDIPF